MKKCTHYGIIKYDYKISQVEEGKREWSTKKKIQKRKLKQRS
jgi:hypothetical protein